MAFAAVHPRPDAGFAANITVDGDAQPDTVSLARLADESVERLREVAESVTVPDRREAGAAEAPALIQRLAVSAAAEGVRRDLVQSQVYLSLPDVPGPGTGRGDPAGADGHRCPARRRSRRLPGLRPVGPRGHRDGGGPVMGRLWNRLTGTRRPADGVAPLTADEVRAALLALNGPDAPYRVRGAAGEKADLVAECSVRRVGVRLRTSMRLVPERHEVRVVEERWENRSAGQAGQQYGRGHAPAVHRQWETGQGPDGRPRKVEAFRFDTREMADPLRDAVLGAGWIWRGAVRL